MNNAAAAPTVRRLGNAGVEIALGDESLVVDLFEDNSPLEPFVGRRGEEVVGHVHGRG